MDNLGLENRDGSQAAQLSMLVENKIKFLNFSQKFFISSFKIQNISKKLNYLHHLVRMLSATWHYYHTDLKHSLSILQSVSRIKFL